MTDLSAFAITKKWPAKHPDRIQLYSLPTPNGVKVSIALEETGLPYEVHRVSFDSHDQMSPEFRSLNPNSKIPALIDPNGPNGKPLPLWESGAILLYLSDKADGKLMPRDAARRWQTVQWLMFQMGGVGPMFGQVGFFHKFAGKDYDDKRPRDRYVAESTRLLAVLEQQLADKAWIMGDDYTIADIATFPWVNNLIGFYGAGELVRIGEFAERHARVGRVQGAARGGARAQHPAQADTGLKPQARCAFTAQARARSAIAPRACTGKLARRRSRKRVRAASSSDIAYAGAGPCPPRNGSQ